MSTMVANFNQPGLFKFDHHPIGCCALKRKLSYVGKVIILFFRATSFLCSPCPNLEGIKDALSYKYRRLTIGQYCCAMCTNEVAKA